MNNSIFIAILGSVITILGTILFIPANDLYTTYVKSIFNWKSCKRKLINDILEIICDRPNKIRHIKYNSFYQEEVVLILHSLRQNNIIRSLSFNENGKANFIKGDVPYIIFDKKDKIKWKNEISKIVNKWKYQEHINLEYIQQKNKKTSIWEKGRVSKFPGNEKCEKIMNENHFYFVDQIKKIINE